jgi:hypothetical protein
MHRLLAGKTLPESLEMAMLAVSPGLVTEM